MTRITGEPVVASLNEFMTAISLSKHGLAGLQACLLLVPCSVRLDESAYTSFPSRCMDNSVEVRPELAGEEF